MPSSNQSPEAKANQTETEVQETVASTLNIEQPKVSEDVEAGTQEALVVESPTNEQITTANTDALEAARNVGPSTAEFVAEITGRVSSNNPLPIALQYLNINELDPEGTKLRAEIWDNVFGSGSKTASKFTKENMAWCAGFVHHILQKAGAEYLNTDSNYDRGRAPDYLKLGQEVANLENAQMGDIVVKARRKKNGGLQYHVAFFSGYDPETNQVFLLGGNQANEVNITAYPIDQVKGIRRVQVDQLTDQEKELISSIEIRRRQGTS